MSAMHQLRSVSCLFVSVVLALSCGAGTPAVRGDDPSQAGAAGAAGANDAPRADELGGRMPGSAPAPRAPAEPEGPGCEGEPIAPAPAAPTAPSAPAGPVAPVAPGPTQPSESAPSDPFAAGILAAHNRVRANVSPAASPPLAPLVWDENLARLARDWTSRCPDGHRPDNDFGENMYWSGGMAASPEDAVESWAEEARNYDYRSTVCSSEGRRNWAACGHYTQLVWRDTARVGCAIRTNCPGQFENVVVCNYDPPGNYNVTSTSIPRPY